MNGDRERKDPLPLNRDGSEPELPPARDHVEPRLRAFGDEPEVARETGLAAPGDLRAAHQSGNSLPVLAITAFVLFCLIGGAYAYLKFADTGAPAPPVAETQPTPAPAYETTPTPAQIAEPAPAPMPPPVAKAKPAASPLPAPVAKVRSPPPQ